MSIYNSYVVPPPGPVLGGPVVASPSRLVRPVPTVSVPLPAQVAPRVPIISSPVVMAPPPVPNGNMYLRNVWVSSLLNWIPYSVLWYIRDDIILNQGLYPIANPSGTDSEISLTFWVMIMCVLGAIVGGFLLKSQGEPRKVCAYGLALMSVWMFAYYWWLNAWNANVNCGTATAPANCQNTCGTGTNGNYAKPNLLPAGNTVNNGGT